MKQKLYVKDIKNNFDNWKWTDLALHPDAIPRSEWLRASSFRTYSTTLTGALERIVRLNKQKYETEHINDDESTYPEWTKRDFQLDPSVAVNSQIMSVIKEMTKIAAEYALRDESGAVVAKRAKRAKSVSFVLVLICCKFTS